MSRLDRIDQSFRSEYIRRMQAEFRQGMRDGEIDLSVFFPGDRRKVRALLDSTLKFRLLLLRDKLSRALKG